MNHNYSLQSYRSMIRSLLFGVGTSVVVTVLIMLMVTVCIQNEYLSINIMPIAAIVIEFLGAATGATVAGKLAKERKSITCLLSAVGWFLLLLVASLVFFTCNAMKVLVCLLAVSAGLCASLLMVKRRKRRLRGRGARW